MRLGTRHQASQIRLDDAHRLGWQEGAGPLHQDVDRRSHVRDEDGQRRKEEQKGEQRKDEVVAESGRAIGHCMVFVLLVEAFEKAPPVQRQTQVQVRVPFISSDPPGAEAQQLSGQGCNARLGSGIVTTRSRRPDDSVIMMCNGHQFEVHFVPGARQRRKTMLHSVDFRVR